LPLLQLQVGASPLDSTSSASSYRQRKAHEMTISRQLYRFESPLRVWTGRGYPSSIDLAFCWWLCRM
jgi:hypothetical protein